MQQIDWLMHSRIGNLFVAKYGRINSQYQCGTGQHTIDRTAGESAAHGMQDTVGWDIANAVDSSAQSGMVDNQHEMAWWLTENSFGTVVAERTSHIVCLGYEDIYGHKYDMMDGVDVPNGNFGQARYRIWMPDGTVRWLQGNTASDQWTTGMWHGLWMDWCVTGIGGSQSTIYGDKRWFSGASWRVVFRGGSYAYADNGLAFTSAISDASSAYSYVGSRLAFRGKIVKAQSVAAYKSLESKA